LECRYESTSASWRVILTNAGATAALPLWLEDDRALALSGSTQSPGYVYFDDNYFILLPGESRSIVVTWQGVPREQRRLRLSGWNVDGQTIG
jgi:hypothetical protein